MTTQLKFDFFLRFEEKNLIFVSLVKAMIVPPTQFEGEN